MVATKEQKSVRGREKKVDEESQNVQRYQKMKAERWLEMGLEYKVRY